MLSAYVELSYADVLLSDGRGGVGYLLKDRVTSLETLVDALRTITAGAPFSILRSSPNSWWRDGLTRSAHSARGRRRCWL